MRFTYCPDCGSKLVLKNIGDEGAVPYCENCSEPKFDMFPACVIVLVVNQRGQVMLLDQSYLSTEYKVLVSGYMKPGESAEEAACREVMEETGIDICDLRLIRTVWFERKEMLMIAFIGYTNDMEFTLSSEVDSAAWVDADKALNMVHPKGPGVASYLLVETYLNESKLKQ